MEEFSSALPVLFPSSLILEQEKQYKHFLPKLSWIIDLVNVRRAVHIFTLRGPRTADDWIFLSISCPDISRSTYGSETPLPVSSHEG